VSIVKVARRVTGSAHAELCGGLSRMRGNSHVRFSGEGVAATPLPYPTTLLMNNATENTEPVLKFRGPLLISRSKSVYWLTGNAAGSRCPISQHAESVS
jgi:hypothetical protein